MVKPADAALPFDVAPPNGLFPVVFFWLLPAPGMAKEDLLLFPAVPPNGEFSLDLLPNGDPFDFEFEPKGEEEPEDEDPNGEAFVLPLPESPFLG